MPALRSARRLDQLRERIRYMHYSLGTEKAYVKRVRFFIRRQGQGGVMRHSRDMGAPAAAAFLTMLGDRASCVGIRARSGACCFFIAR